MQRLEVSGAVRPIYGPLGVKRLTSAVTVRTSKRLEETSLQAYVQVFCSTKRGTDRRFGAVCRFKTAGFGCSVDYPVQCRACGVVQLGSCSRVAAVCIIPGPVRRTVSNERFWQTKAGGH